MFVAPWIVSGGPWGANGGSIGIPLGALGCPNGVPGSSLGTLWGSSGVPGVLPVALEGVFSFLGRPGDGFRENPGNSGSRFGSILDDFLMIFGDIFRLRFLTDF